MPLNTAMPGSVVSAVAPEAAAVESRPQRRADKGEAQDVPSHLFRPALPQKKGEATTPNGIHQRP